MKLCDNRKFGQNATIESHLCALNRNWYISRDKQMWKKAQTRANKNINLERIRDGHLVESKSKTISFDKRTQRHNIQIR